MIKPRIDITEIQKAQQANLKAMLAASPEGGLGKGVKAAAIELHRYSVSITHVGTGSLRAAHRVRMTGPASAEVFIDPGAINPRSKTRPSIYGFYEHARGGAHAFYDRAIAERGKAASQTAIRVVKQELA